MFTCIFWGTNRNVNICTGYFECSLYITALVKELRFIDDVDLKLTGSQSNKSLPPLQYRARLTCPCLFCVFELKISLCLYHLLFLFVSFKKRSFCHVLSYFYAWTDMTRHVILTCYYRCEHYITQVLDYSKKCGGEGGYYIHPGVAFTHWLSFWVHVDIFKTVMTLHTCWLWLPYMIGQFL